jgi:hypothetical protein
MASPEVFHGKRSKTFCLTITVTPTTGKIAVKVINHYGDEVLKVFEPK